MPEFESKVFPGSGWASTWSERHAAYAAGLGTFGLCDGLITPLGKAMRAGSVVARLQVVVGPRPYSDRNAYCLYLTGRGCGECIARCPAGALGPAGHDKEKCHAHAKGICGPYVEKQYGFVGHGCGLCQTGVPCESSIPNP
jgi:epoxyqueuosine reductase QueG